MKRVAPLALCLLVLIGCNSKLDDAHFQADLATYDATDEYLQHDQKMQQAYEFVAGQKHTMQRAVDQNWWDEWKRSHTLDGRLVSTNDRGEIVPLLAEDLDKAIARRERNAVALAQSEISTNEVVKQWVEARTKMKLLNDLSRKGTISTAEAKARGEEIKEHLLKSGGALLGGLLIGTGL